MKRVLAIAIVVAALIPAASHAHDYVTAGACASAAGGPNDCIRIDTDTELEDGLIVTVDGDDSDPRGDDVSDGYVAVHLTEDGAAVYCEDEGGFNHIGEREGGEADDANGDNAACSP